MIIIVILIILILLITTRQSFTSNVNNVYVVCFSHNCCEKVQKRLEKTALQHGVTKVFKLNLSTLDAPESVKQYIKQTQRGAGYWLWKPYALQTALKQSNPGDIIIYADSGTEFLGNLQEIQDFINTYSILCFKHGKKEGDTRLFKWTKGDAINYFGYNNSEWCSNQGLEDQFIGGFIGIKNNDRGIEFLNKFLTTMSPENHQLFDDSPSIYPNCGDFKESRHDQQMLSLILYRYYPNIPFPDYDLKKYGWSWHEKLLRHL